VTAYPLVALACLAGAALSGRALRRKIAIVTVRGRSMQPALTAGDRLLIRRVSPERLRTGQIVVIAGTREDGTSASRRRSWPPAGDDWLIKRLAARPGEPTPALVLTASAPGAEPMVPAGKFVVLGDNLDCSLDSRLLGYIAAERLLGIVIRALPG
jgi:signal peptidase I